MILKFPSRFTTNGKEVGGEIDSKKLSLAGMSRLLLGETIEYDSREELRALVSQRIISILEKLCDEFYGTEKKDQRDFSASIGSIILLVKNNLHDVIVGLNGEQSSIQALAGLIPMNYDLREVGVSKNSLFGTNLRILIAACFRSERLSGLIMDIRECSQIKSGKISFSQMIKRFQYALDRFASDSECTPFEEDDMRQEACIVLWNCVNKYSGQNFIPLRQYFLRSLRNKRIDILRGTHADKRKITLKTKSLSAGSFNESQAHGEITKRYMERYYEWINSPDNDESGSFLAPSSMGEYFPEAGRSITETQINKTVEELFDAIMVELFLSIKTQIPEEHCKILEEFHPTKHIGMTFLRFLFGNPKKDYDFNVMQHFLQTHMKGSLFFDGERYCFGDIGDLKETFLMMCQEILEQDPMIQLALRLSRKVEKEKSQIDIPSNHPLQDILGETYDVLGIPIRRSIFGDIPL